MNRIHIIGGPGSGKTYLAQKLHRTLNLPLCQLDNLFWANDTGSYGIRTESEERDKKLRSFISGPAWIVEGVYYAWVTDSFKHADMILVLTPGPIVRDIRILKRFILRKLHLIPSQKKETLRSLMDLLQWNHNYENSLKKALECLKLHNNKTYIFQSADKAVEFVLKHSGT